MNNHIGNVLNSNATSIGNVDIDSAPVDRLKAVHDQFLLQPYHHVALEHDPERLLLDDSMAESARVGVNRVIITGVCDNVKAAVAAPNGVPAETDATVSQTLSVAVPIRVTPPAVVDWITGHTREKAQFPPLCAVIDAPAQSKGMLLKFNMVSLLAVLSSHYNQTQRVELNCSLNY